MSMSPGAAPEPLTFPTDASGWLAFAGSRSDERIAFADDAARKLAQDPPSSASDLLSSWNDIEVALAQVVSEASLISEAHPDAAVRTAAEERVQAASELAARLMLDRDLWRVFADASTEGLGEDESRILARVLRDFRRGGVDLDDDARERVRVLTQRDTELGIRFSRNVRDGRREVRVRPDALAGLPADFIDAHPPGDDGLVVLTTDYTDLMPVREYATDRETRIALVSAHGDLAWPENDEVLAELLEVRAERARLLGFADWADYETETRMIGAGAEIPAFLARIDGVSRDAADAEYVVALDRLREDDPDATEVTIADFWYVLGALRRERHGVDAQEVRSYLAFDGVLPGVLETTARLFDVEYVPVEVGTWHEDVRSYDVVRGAERLGRIHLDLHPREGKYNHAACFPLSPGIDGRLLPEGVLLCNFSRGLLEHDELVTFFHEFGHLVHAILGGTQRWSRFGPFEMEWDFVEAPSQLLEEWAWDADVLRTFARNADGVPIPADLVRRMREADAFGRALEVRRQLGHAEVSYHLHVDRPADLQTATERIYATTSPVQPVRGLHSYAGFGHLTGYGACYYTYQWSLVIARDLFSQFRGDVMNPAVAARYRAEILEPGASRDARDLVAAFLGRPFSFEPYQQWLAGE